MMLAKKGSDLIGVSIKALKPSDVCAVSHGAGERVLTFNSGQKSICMP